MTLNWANVLGLDTNLAIGEPRRTYVLRHVHKGMRNYADKKWEKIKELPEGERRIGGMKVKEKSDITYLHIAAEMNREIISDQIDFSEPDSADNKAFIAKSKTHLTGRKEMTEALFKSIVTL